MSICRSHVDVTLADKCLYTLFVPLTMSLFVGFDIDCCLVDDTVLDFINKLHRKEKELHTCLINQTLCLLLHPLCVVKPHIFFVFSATIVCLPDRWLG